MPRTGNLRISVAAIAALVVALPLLMWLERTGLVLGDPVVVALLLPLTILVAADGGHPGQGSGWLDGRHVLRILLGAAAVTALFWTAGWTLLVPAGVLVTSVGVLQRARARVAVVACAVAVVATAAGEVALHLDLLDAVVDASASHVAAGALLVVAVLTGCAVARDARAQRGNAHALALAEARLRALMESSTDVLTVSNGGGILTYVSPAAERTMGHRPVDLVGRPLLDIVDAEHRPAVAARLSELMQRGEGARASMDVLVVHASLERRWYEWTFHNMLSDRLVEGMVVQQRDVSERLAAQRALAQAASHDDLTHLPNRGELLKRMAASLPQAGPGAAIAVLFIDLDLFKDVNDHLGHQAGDDVLVVVARRLVATLRAQDHLGRLGGDEFGVLLTEVRDEREVHAVVERLVAAIEQPITLAAGTVAIGASIGYAITTDPRMPLDRLLAAADQRMYQVKHHRRRETGTPPFVPAPDAAPAAPTRPDPAAPAQPAAPAASVRPAEPTAPAPAFRGERRASRRPPAARPGPAPSGTAAPPPLPVPDVAPPLPVPDVAEPLGAPEVALPLPPADGPRHAAPEPPTPLPSTPLAAPPPGVGPVPQLAPEDEDDDRPGLPPHDHPHAGPGR